MTDQPNPIEVQKHLHGVDYPADKSDLVSAARKEGASTEIVDALEGLPGRSFDGPTAVSEALTDRRGE